MAKPLNLDSIIGNPKNRIARVGVELEGGWIKPPADMVLEHDGSVFRDQTTGLVVPPVGVTKLGELPLGPYQPAAIPKAMRKYYPQKVDKTCGMHVHMSFESLLHYGRLMVPEYQETIVEYLGRWAQKEGFPKTHHIWQRLEGKSPYCQKKFWPDLQIDMKRKGGNEYYDQQRPGHRYTIVHYCGRQNTIEVRVLPMMENVDQAIRAIKQVFDITNACLVVLAAKEERIGSKVELPVGEVVEDWVEERL
ncbi:MAG TPA: hypothetical protein VM577_04545 [Anaerovoracaceae bacterium]|nr:hypothetical protein [Anaerovoracaceae bacterium]